MFLVEEEKEDPINVERSPVRLENCMQTVFEHRFSTTRNVSKQRENE